MSRSELIDTYPDFLKYWDGAHDQPVADQIESWSSEYMSRFPELLKKQIEDYSEQDLDWRKIAEEKVFPFLNDRLPVMREARKNLLELCPAIYSKAQELLGFEADVSFVIYVGVGCGAGWVTSYGDQPAILFGLENIAGSGWGSVNAIRGLCAHEIGHVAHYHWRAQNNKALGTGVWWQLYDEGFAQRCETSINGFDSWHEAIASDDWLEWCQGHKGWLAAEFIKAADDGKPVNPFFGSWFEMEGKSQTGYFLGCEVIHGLEEEYSLKEIALLDDIETRSRAILERMRNVQP